VWGKAFFCKLALALQSQFEGVRKIRFGLLDGFALRNRGRKFLNEARIAALFRGFINGCQFQGRGKLAGGELVEGAEAAGKFGAGAPDRELFYLGVLFFLSKLRFAYRRRR